MRPVWIDPAPVRDDLPRLHPHRLVHEVLARRGIASVAAARDFLDGRPRPAPDATGFPNLHTAVARIVHAIEHGERIGVYGDYDADGVTATAVLVRALRAATGSPEAVVARLPRRDEGYGLNQKAIAEFAGQGIDLLIAVDCGSSDHEHVALARAAGLDVISLDHHQIAGNPPEGAIVASPQLPGGERYSDLCSAGIAYLVVTALAQEGLPVDGPSGEPETGLLDLVALGTIADMVPIHGINRALVRDGIARLREGKRVGLEALGRRAGFSLRTADADLIAFKLAPRLNAAGRMADPQIALDLLLEDDPAKAAAIAECMEQLNDRRRAESAKLLGEAERAIAQESGSLDHSVLIVSGRGWPSGLLGPVAAQLAERHQRPAVVLTDDGACSYGSARSVPGFDITAALRASADLLVRFGGHGQAAGLAVGNDRLPMLRERFKAAVVASGLRIPAPSAIVLDADLEPGEATVDTAELLALLQPFGAGNESPVVRLRDIGVRAYDAVGLDKRHLRLQLQTAIGSIKAIGFGLAERSPELLWNRKIDMVGQLKVDRWNGQRRLDFQVIDFRTTT